MTKSKPKEKAQTDNGMDFITLLANYNTAKPEQIANVDVAKSLSPYHDKSKFKFIDDNIVVGDVEMPTANSIGFITSSPSNPQSNIAIFPLNGGEPFLLHHFDNDCLSIGNGEQIIVAKDQEQAFILQVLADTANDTSYTIVFPLSEHHFISLVKAYSKLQQVLIFDMLANREKLEKSLKTDNVKLILTVGDCYDLTEFCLSEIIANPNDDPILATTIIELGSWGEIAPLRDDETTPANQYPIHSWGNGVLRQAVEALAYHAQVPHAIAGQCVLGALSTIGQAFVNAPFGHEHIPTSLFLLAEFESGAGKTRAYNLAYHAIIQDDTNQYQRFFENYLEWKAQKMSLKGKELTDFLQNEPPPTNPEQLVKDITIETVLDHFIMGNKRNLSWTADEAGVFFGGYSMQSDKVANVLGNLTTLWSSGIVKRERSQRTAHATPLTTAYHVRLTMDLAGQREVLEPALTNALLNGQGFLARFLLACPPSLVGYRDWNSKKRMSLSPYDDPCLIAFWQQCFRLLDPLPSEKSNERLNMPFANGAMQCLADYQQQIEYRQRKGNDLEFVRAVAGRMAENATRIATLMAFFDDQKELSIEYLQRAFLLVEYSTNERLRYLDIKPNEKSDIEKLLDWLVKKCKAKQVDRLNWTFIYHNAPCGLQKKSKLLKEYLEVLESGNHIQSEKNGKATLFILNNKLLS